MRTMRGWDSRGAGKPSSRPVLLFQNSGQAAVHTIKQAMYFRKGDIYAETGYAQKYDRTQDRQSDLPCECGTQRTGDRHHREEAGEDDPQGSRAKRRKYGGLSQLSQNQQTGRKICGTICVGQNLSRTYSLV